MAPRRGTELTSCIRSESDPEPATAGERWFLRASFFCSALMAVGSFALVTLSLTRPKNPMRTDFGIFYAAGKLAAGGHLSNAYSIPMLLRAEAAIGGGHGLNLPFPYPPYTGFALSLLAHLSVATAFNVWTAVNLGAFTGAGILALMRVAPRWRIVGILSLAGCVPIVISTAQGENSGLVALGFTLTFLGLDEPWLLTPGIMLLAFKPQFLVVPLTLVAFRYSRPRMVALAAAILPLLLVGLFSGGLEGYVKFVRLLMRSGSWTAKYNWGPAHAYTLQAQIQTFFGHGAVSTLLWIGTSATLLACFLRWYVKHERLTGKSSGELWLTAAAVAVLATTHVMFHDLALIYPAAVVALGTRLRWVALACLVAPCLDPILYNSAHVHVTVLACAVAVLVTVLMPEGPLSAHRMDRQTMDQGHHRLWRLFALPRWASASGSETRSTS